MSVRPREGAWWRVQREVIHRFVLGPARATPPGPLLKTDLFDEASGPHHPLAARPAGFLPVAIDVDAGVARRARARLAGQGIVAPLVVADVRRLPFAAGAFALVVSLSTLDHLASEDEIARALAETFRVLRPGGRLLLTLDNPLNPEVALRRVLPRAIVARLRADIFPLGVTLGPRRGRRVLERAGFIVEDQTYLVHALRYPAIRILALLERRGRAAWAEHLVGRLEALARWPTGPLTGHFVAWVARKPDLPASRAPKRAEHR